MGGPEGCNPGEAAYSVPQSAVVMAMRRVGSRCPSLRPVTAAAKQQRWNLVTSTINQPHSLKAAYPSPGSYVPPVRRADEIGIEWGWLMVKPIQRGEGTRKRLVLPPRAAPSIP